MQNSKIILASVLLLGLGTAADRGGACGAKSPAKEDKKIAVGSEVPDLQAKDHRGQALALRGKDVPITLVYFYPKDNTPG